MYKLVIIQSKIFLWAIPRLPRYTCSIFASFIAPPFYYLNDKGRDKAMPDTTLIGSYNTPKIGTSLTILHILQPVIERLSRYSKIPLQKYTSTLKRTQAQPYV